MTIVTEMQTRILEFLSVFRFLTATQFQRLGVSRNLRVIWRALRRLSQTPTEKRPLIHVIRFPVQARIGGVESFHCLTIWGARFLAELLKIDVSSIYAIQRPVVFTRDYFHRKNCIDFHILLSQHLPSHLTLARFDRYFDKATVKGKRGVSGRFTARTRIELEHGRSLIPDINFILQSATDPNRQALFSFELQNGVDAKRALEKMRRHAEVMKQGALSQAYVIDQNYQAMFLFEQRSLLQAIVKRFSEAGIQGFENLFWFGMLADVQRDPVGRWLRSSKWSQYRNFITGKATS